MTQPPLKEFFVATAVPSAEPMLVAPSRGADVWRVIRTVLDLSARVLALAVIFGVFCVLIPHGAFYTAGNVENLMRQSAVYMMAGLGMTMVIVTGGIDLAVGSTIALAMVVTAKTLVAGGDAGGAVHTVAWTTLAVLAGAAAAAAVGLVQGSLITGLRLVPFIVTLGGLQSIRGLAKGVAGNQEITPSDSNWLAARLMVPVQGRQFNPQLFPPGVWATFVAAIFAAVLLRFTKLGRRIYAIGSNEATARLCGVPVNRTKIIVYVLCGAFAGLAGVLEFSRVGIGQPTGAVSYELYAIAACVIGGTSLRGGVGSIFGTVIGALIIGTLTAGAEQVGWQKWVQEMIVGGVIIAAVALDQLRSRRAV